MGNRTFRTHGLHSLAFHSNMAIRVRPLTRRKKTGSFAAARFSSGCRADYAIIRYRELERLQARLEKSFGDVLLFLRCSGVRP